MHKHIHSQKQILEKSHKASYKQLVVNDDLFSELKEKAFARRPLLCTILEKYGDLSLREFSKLYNTPYKKVIPQERKTQFISAFRNEVERLLGKNVADSCESQLKLTYRVTTTDHHGPLSEPGMVNSNIHEALPYLKGKKSINNIIVLGCANVSFDNESFPRGLLFHSYKNDTLINNQLVFYPRAVRPFPVVYYPAYVAQNLENAKKRIENWVREEIINDERKKELNQLIETIYSREDVLSCKYFSEQVTKTNFLLWKKFMYSYPDAPNLVYIEQEGLVNKLLLEYHLAQPTMINKILFTPRYHELIIKYFDGILRGFSIKEKIGTYLFWALPQGEKYRVQLWKNGNYLETEDGRYRIALTPEGIKNAINKKELIPSTLMSFMLLTFYYGVRLAGGTNQTSYLTQMKEAFISMQKEYGDRESVAFVGDITTTDLSVAIQSMAFLQTPYEARIPATGIDFILYSNKATIAIMEQIARTLTVRETFYRALPDCYKWYYKEEEREEHISKITKDDMEKYLGIEHKIVPSAKIC